MKAHSESPATRGSAVLSNGSLPPTALSNGVITDGSDAPYSAIYDDDGHRSSNVGASRGSDGYHMDTRHLDHMGHQDYETSSWDGDGRRY